VVTGVWLIAQGVVEIVHAVQPRAHLRRLA